MMRSGTEPPFVLVVDDEDEVRETMSELVEMFGCAVMTAGNGAEALALLADHRPCLIVLDLVMPVMTGEELLEAMQRRPALAALPVVISTSAPERAPSGLPVLRKPLDVEAFMSCLRRNCECAGARPT
jgi:CheY-like chemotaxis protein